MSDKNYDGVIILGRNWRGYPFKKKPVKVEDGSDYLEIQFLAKVNCRVAANMYESGRTKKIIIGTGKTAGKNYRSEALAMKDYILRISDVPKKDILTQEKTLDTYDELREDLKLAHDNDLEKLALVSIDTQLPKCKRFLDNQGIFIDYISCEKNFINNPFNHKWVIDSYHKSCAFKYEWFKEKVLLRFAGPKFTKFLAKILRK